MSRMYDFEYRMNSAFVVFCLLRKNDNKSGYELHISLCNYDKTQINLFSCFCNQFCLYKMDLLPRKIASTIINSANVVNREFLYLQPLTRLRA